MIIDYPDFWPFFTRLDDGRMAGFFHDIVTEASARLGVTVTWREYPWKRSQDNVKHGQADAMITVPTPERLEYAATHQTPFYLKRLHVFTRVGHPKTTFIRSMQNLDDIKRGELSVITYTGNGWNDKHIRSRGIRVHETSQIQGVWLMLAEGRGDIVIEWPVAAWADIDSMGIDRRRLIQTDVVFDPMPFHLLIGKQSPLVDLLPRFNDVVLEMQRNGRIAEIVGRYEQ